MFNSGGIMVKISVIVPCYNVEKYVGECLDSVINQTFNDLEILCINDGSTDNTLSILESYAEKDSRIKLFCQENKGLSATRNFGIDVAKGEYIAFIDADDYYDLTTFEQLYDLTANGKKLDVIFFKLIDFCDDTKVQYPRPYFDMEFLKQRVKDNVFCWRDISDMLLYLSVTAPGKLFRNEIIKDIRFPEGLIFEDNPFFIEVMFNAQRVYFHDKYLYHRRIRQDSITQSNTIKFADSLIIHDLMIEIIKNNGYWDIFKERILNMKFSNAYKMYKMVDDEYKPEFFNKIKDNFSGCHDEIINDEVYDDLNDRSKFIFQSALNCEYFDEFELTVDNYNLMLEIEEYKKFNRLALSSNSWKLTKPLRILGRLRSR